MVRLTQSEMDEVLSNVGCAVQALFARDAYKRNWKWCAGFQWFGNAVVSTPVDPLT
jgi:hypothetical protein